MKKFVLVPDSFKGTMSSIEVCEIMTAAIHRFLPDAQVVSIPVADGGEGSVDAFLQSMGGEKVWLTVDGPYHQPVHAFYGRIGNLAVIEMASAAGLPLVDGNRDVKRTTTYGVGQIMMHAVQNGATKIVMGLGGSATNDGGAGAAAAMGVRFYDDAGKSFIPVGGTLAEIASIDTTGLPQGLSQVEIITICDIDNPLCGEDGAAAVFGPQKGASNEIVQLLDKGLAHLATVIKRDLDVDVLNLQGAGAAGGMGAGMVAFFGSQLQMGIDTVLNTVNFDSLASNADVVFTGEGKLDGQSLHGKVVIGVAHRCKKANVPVFAIVGDIGDCIEAVYEQGVTGVFSINRIAAPFCELKHRAKDDLRLTMENLVRCSMC